MEAKSLDKRLEINYLHQIAADLMRLMVGTTASMTANRITISVTPRQREYLLVGMRKHQLGLSEYLRRVLDRSIENDQWMELQRRSLP